MGERGEKMLGPCPHDPRLKRFQCAQCYDAMFAETDQLRARARELEGQLDSATAEGMNALTGLRLERNARIAELEGALRAVANDPVTIVPIKRMVRTALGATGEGRKGLVCNCPCTCAVGKLKEDAEARRTLREGAGARGVGDVAQPTAEQLQRILDRMVTCTKCDGEGSRTESGKVDGVPYTIHHTCSKCGGAGFTLPPFRSTESFPTDEDER